GRDEGFPRRAGRPWGDGAARLAEPVPEGTTILPDRSLQLRVAEAGDEVVVHHPHRLHERVADGRSDEAESALDERLAHAVGLLGARRELAQRAARVLFGRAADEAP